MKTITIKKLRVGSFAKTVGIVQAVFGFVTGLIVSLSVAAESINETTSFVAALGVSLFTLGLAVIFFPLVAFFVGWVQGAVAAVILNFAFAEGAGLDIEVE